MYSNISITSGSSSNPSKFVINPNMLSGINPAMLDAFGRLENNLSEEVTTIRIRIDKRICPGCNKELVWETKSTHIVPKNGNTTQTDEVVTSPEGCVGLNEAALSIQVGKSYDSLAIPPKTCCSLDCLLMYIQQFVLESRLEKK